MESVDMMDIEIPEHELRERCKRARQLILRLVPLIESCNDEATRAMYDSRLQLKLIEVQQCTALLEDARSANGTPTAPPARPAPPAHSAPRTMEVAPSSLARSMEMHSSDARSTDAYSSPDSVDERDDDVIELTSAADAAARAKFSVGRRCSAPDIGAIPRFDVHTERRLSQTFSQADVPTVTGSAHGESPLHASVGQLTDAQAKHTEEWWQMATRDLGTALSAIRRFDPSLYTAREWLRWLESYFEAEQWPAMELRAVVLCALLPSDTDARTRGYIAGTPREPWADVRSRFLATYENARHTHALRVLLDEMRSGEFKVGREPQESIRALGWHFNDILEALGVDRSGDEARALFLESLCARDANDAERTKAKQAIERMRESFDAYRVAELMYPVELMNDTMPLDPIERTRRDIRNRIFEAEASLFSGRLQTSNWTDVITPACSSRLLRNDAALDEVAFVSHPRSHELRSNNQERLISSDRISCLLYGPMKVNTNLKRLQVCVMSPDSVCLCKIIKAIQYNEGLEHVQMHVDGSLSGTSQRLLFRVSHAARYSEMSASEMKKLCMSAIVHPRLTSLDVSGPPLRCGPLTNLGELLTHNGRIRSLVIGTKPSVQLRIPDGALCAFAHIVKTSSLTKLHLRGTAGSRNATGDALCKILKECKGLTDVDITPLCIKDYGDVLEMLEGGTIQRFAFTAQCSADRFSSKELLLCLEDRVTEAPLQSLSITLIGTDARTVLGELGGLAQWAKALSLTLTVSSAFAPALLQPLLEGFASCSPFAMTSFSLSIPRLTDRGVGRLLRSSLEASGCLSYLESFGLSCKDAHVDVLSSVFVGVLRHAHLRSLSIATGDCSDGLLLVEESLSALIYGNRTLQKLSVGTVKMRSDQPTVLLSVMCDALKHNIRLRSLNIVGSSLPHYVDEARIQNIGAWIARNAEVRAGAMEAQCVFLMCFRSQCTVLNALPYELARLICQHMARMFELEAVRNTIQLGTKRKLQSRFEPQSKLRAR